MTNLIGQSLGRYHILEQLGEGGMAVVYKAYDIRLEREVAIKVIRTDLFGKAVIERILKRFEREAKVVAKLSHPNIVGVLDYGEYDGAPYLVLEYLLGGTLKEQMQGNLMPWEEAVRLLLPIANALDYAHEHKVIHRDVKPANILLTEKGQPMLGDFGIAKILEMDDGHTLTGTGMGVGTPEYMSPEQGMGREIDARADIYSLGIVFYELITGRKPYAADTPMAVVPKHMTDPLPRPSQYVPNLPDEVEHILLKALAKTPNDRFPDAGALASALENLTSANKPRTTVSDQLARSTEDSSETMDAFATTQQNQTMSGTLTIDESDSPEIQNIPTKEYQHRKRNLTPWIFFAVIGVGLVMAGIVLVILLINWSAKSRDIAQVQPTSTQIFTPTNIPTQTIVPTDTPTAIIMPVATLLPKSVDTPHVTAGPALGIGSTMTGNDGMTMLYVPAGEFTMGTDNGYGSFEEMFHHIVYLDSFWIDQTEVTNKQYAACVSDGDCTLPSNISSHLNSAYYYNSQFVDYPVIFVNWNQANAYCSWAGRRLPTEAQWEKAARGTDRRMYPWGDNDPIVNLLNFNQNIGDTSLVGNYTNGASPYGAYDMAGNVFEWVADWYEQYYYYSSPDSNPLGPNSGEFRVLRGGSWSDHNFVRTTARFTGGPSAKSNNIGFRCARSDP